jgi:GGDEF domain-containing protein
MLALLFAILALCYRLLSQQRVICVFVAKFLLVFGAWIASEMQLMQLMLLDDAVFWHYLGLGAVYLLPLIGAKIIHEIVPEDLHSLTRLMIVLYAMAFLIVVFRELSGQICMDAEMASFIMFYCMGQSVLGLALLYGIRDGAPLCRPAFLPMVGTPFLLAADAVAQIHCAPVAIIFLAYFTLCIVRDSMREQQHLTQLTQQLRQRVADISEKAQVDALTKCLNRGTLQESLDKEIAQAGKAAAPLSLLMFDLDHFKSINDTYGHDAGDRVLRGFADLVRRHLKERHTFIRYGGEEFVVLCEGTSLRDAVEFADEIREHLAGSAIF